MLHRAIVLLLSLATISIAVAPHARADPESPAGSVPRSPRPGQLPLRFERSTAPAASQASWLARGVGYTIALDHEGARLDVGTDGDAPASVRLRLRGAAMSGPVPEQPAGVAHYYLGARSQDWRTNVPTYARVRYPAPYPGIDVVYYGNERHLEYDFEVAPGADWRAIRLAFDGADRIRVDPTTGELVLHVQGREVRQPAPFTYQGHRDTPVVVQARYVVHDDGEVGFDVGAYDATRPLVIDPVIVYSSFLGGTGDDVAYDVAVDATGAAYIVGETASPGFPRGTTHNGTFGGGTDVFVAKLTPAGDALVYTAFLGGTASDQGASIALDATGNVFIAGRAGPGFPTTTGVVQPTHANGSGYDAFVAKLSTTGALVYATYLGGDDGAAEQANDIAVGADGTAYVVGATRSRNFPVANALYPTHNGYYSDTALAFVSRLNATGTSLLFSTYLGNQSQSSARGVAVDGTGAIYVAGFAGGIPTGGSVIMDFPVKQPFRPGFYGGPFLTKFAPGGGSLVYSTVVGDANGSFGGQAEDLAIDAAGNAYITGSISASQSGNTLLGPLPPVNAFEATPKGGLDGFVMKVNAAGTAIVYSTYLAGTPTSFDTGSESGRAIAVDASGRAYVVGYSNSANFPQVNPLPVGGNAGPWDAFVTRFDPEGCAIGYSTFVGGSNTDDAFGVTVDAAGNAYVVGDTASGNFPIVGGVQSTHQGGRARPQGGRESDAFVMKLAPLVTDTASSRCDTRGKRPTDPVLPTQTVTPPQQPPIFRFFDLSALWFDPPIATGYLYTMTGSALFTAVLDFPTGIDADDRFTVSVDGIVLGEFGPGQPVRFTEFATQLGTKLVRGIGVAAFNVSGIAPARETEDPLAFPIRLEFDVPSAGFSMQATTASAPVVPATISLAQATRRALRGAGSVTLTATRSGDTTTAVSAAFATTAGTATPGSDYTTTSGTVAFAAGQTSATITVPVDAGTGNATSETFTVTLSAPGGGASIGGTPTTTVTLLDGSAVFTQYFAEGATGPFFDTRLALVNPTPAAAEVLLVFQRADSAVFTSTMTLPAGTRATVRPATIPGLEAAEFSTRIDAEARIVADRTMLWDSSGYGSHAEASVAAPGTEWYFAEGATFAGFDLFYLLQNPGAQASTVEVTYLLPAPAAPVVKTYVVPAASRFTIWVDLEDARLADTAVSIVVESTNAVPIIVERSMWWPGASSTWQEAHSSPGATAVGTRWVSAEGEVGGAAAVATYVLIANTSTTAGTARVTLLFEDGTSAERTFPVAATSRFNVDVGTEFPVSAGRRFGVVVESLGSPQAQLVVERAMYANAGGVTWAAGSNALATRLQ